MTFLTWNRPMTESPASLVAFQRRFPDDDACARRLIAVRWPNGFRCPACGHDRGWELKTRLHSFECARCHRQALVVAGTLPHRTRLSLAIRFRDAYLMATHCNGISALQLQKRLGIGSYRSAWMLAAKLRRAMVTPERSPLSGLVEIDEACLPQRDKGAPPGPGRSPEGKMPVACSWPRSGPAAPRISATSLCATPPRPSRQTAGSSFASIGAEIAPPPRRSAFFTRASTAPPASGCAGPCTSRRSTAASARTCLRIAN